LDAESYLNERIFTARHVCIALTMPWQEVCLTVSPSVCYTPVFCGNG